MPSAGRRRPEEPIPGLPGKTLGDFWSWAYSDIVSNRNRGIFAEYIVGAALGCIDAPRVEWDASDLLYQGKRIEVKSAAYVQAWAQRRPSAIRWDIRPRRVWSAETNVMEAEPRRAADAFVFCLYPIADRSQALIERVEDWQFWVLPVVVLEQRGFRRSVGLRALEGAATACAFPGLKAEVDRVLGLA